MQKRLSPGTDACAVVNPEGQGAHLELYSWGSPGEIADLARMPSILRETVPWLRIDRRRIYAVGGSMGGQESLLLAAKHPHLLAGVVSFDAPTNMATRYAAFPLLKGGRALQELARLEFGSVPRVDGDAWADRSPLFYSRELAFANVPMQIWWSRRDQIVVNQADLQTRSEFASAVTAVQSQIASLRGATSPGAGARGFRSGGSKRNFRLICGIENIGANHRALDLGQVLIGSVAIPHS